MIWAYTSIRKKRVNGTIIFFNKMTKDLDSSDFPI